MKKFYCMFITFQEEAIECFFLGCRFSKIFSKKSKKICLFKIFKWVIISLTELFFSKFSLLFFSVKKNSINYSFNKFSMSRQKIKKWKIIKENYKKKCSYYGFIFYKKILVEPVTMTLFEIIFKYFSLTPTNFLVSSKYGENLVDYIQQNEFEFLLSYLKIAFSQLYFTFIVIKRYRYNFFSQFFHISPEHICSLLGEELFSTFLVILVKLLLVKFKNKINFGIGPQLQNLLFSNLAKNRKSFTDRILYGHKFLVFYSLQAKESYRTFKYLANKSLKHSWGVFSNSYLGMLSIILEYRGLKTGKICKNKIENSNRHRKKNLFFFELNPKVTIDATFFGNVGRLLNHGCKTNSYTRILKHNKKNFVFIISKKSITFFEEICYDYRINIDEIDSEQIQCICFSLDCKKELTI